MSDASPPHPSPPQSKIWYHLHLRALPVTGSTDKDAVCFMFKFAEEGTPTVLVKLVSIYAPMLRLAPNEVVLRDTPG